MIVDKVRSPADKALVYLCEDFFNQLISGFVGQRLLQLVGSFYQRVRFYDAVSVCCRQHDDDLILDFEVIKYLDCILRVFGIGEKLGYVLFEPYLQGKESHEQYTADE